ncbi:MAG: helix-turn-helix domain-containing protein [Spirulina sp.]
MTENCLLTPLVTRLHLQDVDELTEIARRWNWNSDYRPLQAGNFNSTVCLAHLDDIQFTYESWSQAMNLQGESPSECLSFGIVSYGDRNIWLGQPLFGNGIAITQASRGIDLTAKPPFALWTASVPIEILQATAREYGYLLPDRLLQGKISLIHPPAFALAPLKGYLHNLLTLIQNTPETLTQPTMQCLVRQDFLSLLIEALVLSDLHPQCSSFSQYRLVKQIEEMVLRNARKPLTLQELSKIVHFSPRALNNIFQACVSMSPMAYLKAQRLNGARCQLKTSNPKDTNVVDVASQWGFCHMGYFSRDYKKMFGESPSTTLRRI